MGGKTSDLEQPLRQNVPPADEDLDAAAFPHSRRPDGPTAWAQRRRSVSFGLICLIGLLDAIEYGLVMPSLYKYLGEVDPVLAHNKQAYSHMYGAIISSFSFASMCSKPIIGTLADRRSFKETFIWTTIVAIAGNLLYFAARHLSGMDGGKKPSERTRGAYLILAARLLAGVGCANTALTFAYVARTTSIKERTSKMTLMSMVKVMGFALGPATNALTSMCDFEMGNFRVDPGNSPGLLIAVVQTIALFLIFVLFKDPPAYAADDAEAIARAAKMTLRARIAAAVGPYFNAPVLICCLNILVFNLLVGVSESIIVPVTSAAFRWSALENSYVYLVLTLVNLVVSIFVMATSKRIPERVFLLVACLLASGALAYQGTFFFFDMDTATFWTGVVLLIAPISFAFSPNRAMFSKLVASSRYQGLLSSLLSILSSVGGILGPAIVGGGLGSPPEDPIHQRVATTVYEVTGAIVGATLVANTIVLFWLSPPHTLYTTATLQS